MSARIRFRGGPLAGKAFDFDDEKTVIVIGRDPEHSDVVLPADMTDVGREHVALKRVLGRYRLVLSPTHPVLLDGEPATNDKELPEVAYLQLGEDGPQLVVQTIGSTVAPPTLDQGEPTPHLGDLVNDAVQRARITRQIAFLTAGLLAALSIIGFFAFRRTGKRVRRVTEEQAHVRGRLEEEAALRERLATEQLEATNALRGRIEGVDALLERIQPDLSGLRQAVDGLGPRMQGLEDRIQKLGPRIREALKAAAPSVYVMLLVGGEGREDAIGTAWVAEGGVLVTNAHVADLLEQIKSVPRLKNTTLIARSPGTAPRDHRVIGARVHPGWKVFGELWREYRPTDIDVAGGLNPLRTSGACDVALLEVESADALAPPLTIASEKTLRAVGAGDVVGFLGYPAEDMASGGVNIARPNPTTQIAHVTAVTNFFLAPDDEQETLLVQHSLPAAGGASGSPVFDQNGHVIAVLNAGNVTIGGLGQRIPSAVLVNFAQRADLVAELISGEAPQRQTERTRRWRDGIRTFTSLRAAVEQDALAYLDRYLEEVKKKVGTDPEEIDDRTGVLSSGPNAPPIVTEDEIVLSLPGKGVYVFFAHTRLGRSVGLEVADAKDPNTALAQDSPDHWHAVLQVEADGASEVIVRVRGFSNSEYRLVGYRFAPKA